MGNDQDGHETPNETSALVDIIAELSAQVAEQRRLISELSARAVERESRIEQLRLAYELLAFTPPRKRPGAPKKVDVQHDIELLEMIEDYQRRFGCRSRAAAVDALVERVRENRRQLSLPRRNRFREAQEKKTILNRLAVAAKQRNREK